MSTRQKVILFNLIFVLSIIFSCRKTLTNESKDDKGKLDGKTILMIIGSSDFRDEELLEPKSIFEQEKAKVIIASTTLSEVTGMLGAKIKPDIHLKNIKVKNYDAIIFVGGYGAEEYLSDSLAHKIAKECIKQKKILGAICMGPAVLANAGVLKGKKATCASFTRYSNNSSEVIDTGKDVERDGNIITAIGPYAATAFGEKILEVLIK